MEKKTKEEERIGGNRKEMDKNRTKEEKKKGEEAERRKGDGKK